MPRTAHRFSHFPDPNGTGGGLLQRAVQCDVACAVRRVVSCIGACVR